MKMKKLMKKKKATAPLRGDNTFFSHHLQKKDFKWMRRSCRLQTLIKIRRWQQALHPIARTHTHTHTYTPFHLSYREKIMALICVKTKKKLSRTPSHMKKKSYI